MKACKIYDRCLEKNRKSFHFNVSLRVIPIGNKIYEIFSCSLSCNKKQKVSMIEVCGRRERNARSYCRKKQVSRQPRQVGQSRRIVEEVNFNIDSIHHMAGEPFKISFVERAFQDRQAYLLNLMQN